jgi:hypothetical protein
MRDEAQPIISRERLDPHHERRPAQPLQTDQCSRTRVVRIVTNLCLLLIRHACKTTLNNTERASERKKTNKEKLWM